MDKGSKLYSLKALSEDPLATRNTVLFAALTALGIPVEPGLCGEFVEQRAGGEKRSVTVWRLREKSLDGRWETAQLIKLWNDSQFLERESEHPLAYIKAAFENHARALDFLKDQGPIVMRRRGKKIGFITKRTPDALKRKIIDDLNAP